MRAAAGAPGAARQGAREYAPRIEPSDAVRLGRARRLQLFLTQPFFTASEHTGWEGVSVPLAETLDGCEAILKGEGDEIVVSAFGYSGNLEDVRRRAESGEHRRFD